jgi:hypothetical protein
MRRIRASLTLSNLKQKIIDLLVIRAHYGAAPS